MPSKSASESIADSSQGYPSLSPTSRAAMFSSRTRVTVPGAETPAGLSCLPKSETNGRMKWLADAATKGRVPVLCGGRDTGYETRWMTPLAARLMRADMRRHQKAVKGSKRESGTISTQ